MKLLEPIDYINDLLTCNKWNIDHGVAPINYLMLEKIEYRKGEDWYVLNPLNILFGYQDIIKYKDGLTSDIINIWNKRAEEILERYNNLKAFT